MTNKKFRVIKGMCKPGWNSWIAFGPMRSDENKIVGLGGSIHKRFFYLTWT
jgi:hypothetical protein